MQIILSIVILFAVSLVWMLSLFTQSVVNTQIQSSDVLDNSSKAVMQEQTDAAPVVFDDGFGLVAVIVWLIVVGFAYKAPSNPFLIVAIIVIMAAVGFVGMILSNSWSEIASNPSFTSTVDNLPITDFLLSNFLIYIIVLFASSIIAYAYGSGGSG